MPRNDYGLGSCSRKQQRLINMNYNKFNKLNHYTNNTMLDLYNFTDKEDFFALAKRMNIHNIEILRAGELLKFRKWDPNFELPKEIIVKTELITYVASRKDQHIIKRALYAKIEKFGEFKNRWNNKEYPPRFWGNAHKLPYYEKDGWLWVKLHNNWIFEAIPKKEDFIYKDDWIFLSIPEGYLGISYTSEDYHNNFILIPSVIKADYFFFEGLGLQQGDGTQSLSDSHITFTNSCIDLIYHQIAWFNNLGISSDVMRIYPEIPANSDVEQEKLKWISYLSKTGIKNDQFRSSKIGNKNIKNSLVQLLFHNRLFKLFYLYLMYNLRDDILKDKIKAAAYVKGILAAEGAVRLDTTKILGSIKISASSAERRNFYKKCLNSIGIEVSKDDLTKGSEAVIITHFNNFRKIYDSDLLQLHPAKHGKFNRGFMNYKAPKKIMIVSKW